ncbi:succinate--CoA ligase subunit alpha [Paracoccus sp. M683]|uniref:succinate--CoA ligase subunit alpha n=1 Tax=Paracoccus sp. M683 TaxID=2594268 RepID=UPI00117C1254|nr:succinate--CoA ligase subunit alpha [Paracoccus sp. M683]TRW94582.1 succinate--CoA ligase subunit alpha [Paracoccus sp. M683]
MGILLKPDSRVVIQNVHSSYAAGLIRQMRLAGTQIVGGVQAGAGGTDHLGLPVFDLVSQAVDKTGADVSVVYTPAFGVAAAIVEAVDAGIALVSVAAEHAPVHDMMPALAHARNRGAWVIGPNSLGLLNPGQGMLGGLPAGFGMPGRVGVISRSGTLAIAMLRRLTAGGIGQSTVVSVGGDAITGRRPAEYARLMDADPATEAIVLIGEIGGGKEDELAAALPDLSTPVFAMIVGRSLPEGRQFGHAGALARNGSETAVAKARRLKDAGATICDSPLAVVTAIRQLFDRT